MPAFPLLSTKLNFPPRRPGRVARPRLLEKLERSLLPGNRLTILSAPAGFGKTSLAVDWLSLLVERGLPCAWLSLEESDNDLVRFLHYFVAALQKIQPELGQAALALLELPQLPAVEALMLPLINELGALPGDCVLVLDDYHLIRDLAIHQALGYLVDHQPAQLHLVLTARGDPLLPLARLRARGEVTEIRSADLRFTPGEALEFVQRAARLSLTPGQLSALDQSTEGWIAGLQMAALALQPFAERQTAPEAVDEFLASFSGTHQYVFDYLAQEVLGRQEPAVVEFLSQTSILDRFCAPLCEAVIHPGGDAPSSGIDVRATLDYMTRANFFIIPLDERHQWYRYHRLFADFLRAGLDAGRLPELYRRAAAWCERNGLEEEAVTYALAAGDWPAAGRLMIQLAARLLATGQMTTLLNWFEALPVEVRQADVDLCAYHGWISLLRNRVGIAQSMVEQGERALSPNTHPSSRGRLLGLKAYVVYAMEGDRPAAVRLAEEAVRLLDPGDTFFVILAQTLLGQIQRDSGSVPAAIRTLEAVMGAVGRAQASERPEASECILQGDLTLAYFVHGERSRAVAQGEAFLRQLAGPGGQVYLPALFTLMALAPIYYYGNQLAAARTSYERGLELCQQMGVNPIIIGGSDVYAGIQFAEGDGQGALATLRASRDEAVRMQLPWIASALAAVEVSLRLRLGDLSAAEAWAASAGLPPVTTADPNRFLEQSLQASLLIVQQDFGRAHTLLAAMRTQAEEFENFHHLLPILLLLGLACQGLEKPDEALAHVERAARLAAPEGSMRYFLDLPCDDLLRQLRRDLKGQPDDHLSAFLDQVLAMAASASRASGAAPASRVSGAASASRASGAASAQAEKPPLTGLLAPAPPPSAGLVEPITRRELDVLRLMAEGLSNAEIARRLYLTLNTLKAHTNSIYGKLDVHSRLQAVNRARQLGLLEAPEN
jgi:LuxR family maltose regulon positive regulatory protein